MQRVRPFRLLLFLMAVLSLLAGLRPASSAGAASMTVKQSRTVGAYRLVLVVGPAEGMSAEMSAGGARATCSMKGGMHLAAMSGNMCNHHVELHVYSRRTGMVVARARVTIAMRDRARRMTIVVPIMRMIGMNQGMKDFHYGNNVYAPAGNYTVLAAVNTARAVFTITLR